MPSRASKKRAFSHGSLSGPSTRKQTEISVPRVLSKPVLAFIVVLCFFAYRYLFAAGGDVVFVETREMRFLGPSEKSFHAVGRWVLSEDKTALETAWSGGYIDIRHNSSKIVIHYGHHTPIATRPFPRPGERKVQLLVGLDDAWQVHKEPTGPRIIQNLATGMKTTRFIFPRPDPASTVQFHGIHVDKDTHLEIIPPRKLIELITDSTYLGDFSKTESLNEDDPNVVDVIRTIYNWPYMTANNFNADIRIVGVDGACLEDRCPSMEGDGEGMARAYWRRVPGHIGNSSIKNAPWEFETEQTPDAIIVHFGHTNYISSQLHPYAKYDRNRYFMDTLHEFLGTLRRAAYPMPLHSHSSCLDNLPCPMPDLPQFAHKKHKFKSLPIFLMQPCQLSMSTPINFVYESIRDSTYEDPDPLLFRIDSANSLWLPKPPGPPFYYSRRIPARHEDGQPMFRNDDGPEEVLSWTMTTKAHIFIFRFIFEFLCPWIEAEDYAKGGDKCDQRKLGAPYDGHVWLNPSMYERGKGTKHAEERLDRVWKDMVEEERNL